MPNVAVDLSQLSPDGRNGGAARFVLDLLAALAREPGLGLQLLVRPGNEGLVEGIRSAGARVLLLGPSGEAREPRRLRRTLRRLPAPVARLLPDQDSLRRLGADVLFSPLQSAAFHEPGLPHVAVGYDLQELTYPENFASAELRRRAGFRADLRRCDRVVAISTTTRDDLVARAGLCPARVTVIPPAGPSERLRRPEEEVRAVLSRLGLEPGSYAIYPANYWPHKNHERLLDALLASPLAVDTGFRLVFCGALDSLRRPLESLVGSLGLGSRVVVLTHQAEDDLTALLQGALLLVFPSLFEGFGIPVLEAFRLGVPVACSDIAAFRELADDAALYFEPTSPPSIAAALVRLHSDALLRDRLRERGFARARLNPAAAVPGAFHRVLLGATRAS